MTILDRYFLRRFLVTVLRTAISLVALYCVIDMLSERRSEILQHDVPWNIVLQYYASAAPMLLYQVMPLAILVAGLMVFGDAAQKNEVTAVLAGGVSLRRLVAAPVIAAALVAGSMFLLHETVGAASYREAERINNAYFQLSADGRRSGVSWANLEGGWTCHILKFNRLALTGEQVYMYALRDDANEQIVARRIYWDENRATWILEDGSHMAYAPDWSMRRRQSRITQAPAPIQETPETLFALDAPADSKTSGELAQAIAQAEIRGLQAKEHWVDYYAKFSYPAINFVMIWLAIPFAFRLRRGGLAIGFGLSVAIALVYLMVYGASVGLGQLGNLHPIAAAWMANALFFAAGCVLFLRTPT
jgi:lipopolysaccharide export system permease protein